MMSSCRGDRPHPGPERSTEEGAHHTFRLTIAVWALAVFTAFLFGSTIVNIYVADRAYDAAKSQVETIRTLNASLREVQRSMAELSRVIREAQETPREEEEEELYPQMPYMGDEKV